MPNSMTNLEINDVLSSIRRLVSGDKSAMKKVAKPTDDFFVLTPAHRVVTEFADAEDLPDLTANPENPSESQREPDSPFELVNPAFPASEIEYTGNNISDKVASDDDTIRITLVPDAVPVSTLPANDAEPTLEDRIAELEEAVSRSDDDWEPDGSELDTIQMPERHLFEIVDNTEMPEVSVEKDFSDVNEGEQQQPAAASFSHVETGESSKIKEEAPLQLAEVATFTHVPSMSTETPAAPLPEPVILTPAREEVLEGNDDIFVDEDLLRRVVSDIVREELQGKLGERITRNLRRMVRREIEQTLSLKDFD